MGIDDELFASLSYTASDVAEDWTYITIPLDELAPGANVNNGVLDGGVAGFELAIAGIAGAPGTSVEVDVHHIDLTNGPEVPAARRGSQHWEPVPIAPACEIGGRRGWPTIDLT